MHGAYNIKQNYFILNRTQDVLPCKPLVHQEHHVKSNCGIMFASEINDWVTVEQHSDTAHLMDMNWARVPNSMNLQSEYMHSLQIK